MKKIFILTLLFHTLHSFSQVENKTQKVVKIIDPQSFYLNGGTKNLVGGNSRAGFKIDLPPNTIEWFYAFTTEPNQNGEQNLQLQSQLELLLKTTGFSSNLLDLIKIPDGQGLIDLFLTDRKGYDLFFEKDFFGLWKYTSPNHTIEGSRTSMREAKVKIDDVKSGSHFLVIRNTSGTNGVNVKLEVVAIVEEITIDVNLWNKKTKDQLFNSLKNDIQKVYTDYNDDKIDELTGCVITKLTTNLKPSDLNTTAEYELKVYIKKWLAECNL